MFVWMSRRIISIPAIQNRSTTRHGRGFPGQTVLRPLSTGATARFIFLKELNTFAGISRRIVPIPAIQNRSTTKHGRVYRTFCAEPTVAGRWRYFSNTQGKSLSWKRNSKERENGTLKPAEKP